MRVDAANEDDDDDDGGSGEILTFLISHTRGSQCQIDIPKLTFRHCYLVDSYQRIFTILSSNARADNLM